MQIKFLSYIKKKSVKKMKNKILVITPMYKTNGRPDLVKDSECVHQLVRYWTKEHDVFVLNNYINGLSKVKTMFKLKKLKKFFNGDIFYTDNVKVLIAERQNILPFQIDCTYIDSKRILRIMKKRKFDLEYFKVVVHLPSTSQNIIKQLKKDCNKIAVLHHTDLRYLKENPKKFSQFLNKYFDRVLCRSYAIYKEASKFNINKLDNRIISSGVNTIPLRKKRNFNKNKLNFLYVGKLIKRKNLDLLLNALSKLDKNVWYLEVVGDGKMRNEYNMLVDKLEINDNVNFIGKLTHDAVMAKMEKSEIFCMPSVDETLGLVYLEAMSKGCLTIGTKNEGIDGIIKDKENGFLIEPNLDSLLECIKYIYRINIEEKTKISNAAIETAIKYNEEDMSIKYLDIVMED